MSWVSGTVTETTSYYRRQSIELANSRIDVY
jgi:hypothetical protein